MDTYKILSAHTTTDLQKFMNKYAEEYVPVGQPSYGKEFDKGIWIQLMVKREFYLENMVKLISISLDK